MVGLGGANTYSRVARAEDFGTIGGVLRALLEGGGAVLDTAAGYGAAHSLGVELDRGHDGIREHLRALIAAMRSD